MDIFTSFFFFFLRLIETCLIRHTTGREASCVLQCPTPPILCYNCLANIRWRYVVQSCLQRCSHTMLIVTVHLVRVPVRTRFSRCRARLCPMGLFDGLWTNSLNRQLMVSHLVSQVPSAHVAIEGLLIHEHEQCIFNMYYCYIGIRENLMVNECGIMR